MRAREPTASLAPLFVLAAAGVLLAAVPGAASEALRFREVAAAWGLDFRHHHGGSGERFMVETMVGGVVLFDYDGDGDDDVFFVDGGVLPGYDGEPPRSRLYRNDLAGQSPRFTDVTAEAGIEFAGYGCGGAAADIDGDGDVDLLLTAFGQNALFRNRGDGTFEEVATAAGLVDDSWSSSAAFADVDRDGDLDLYVAGYVDFALDRRVFCGNRETGVRGYCHPDKYQGVPDRLYRNDGTGRFADATVEAGLEGAREAGLGVVFTDFDADGWPDLYVANDLDPNFLFRNRGDGTFEDVSLLSGTALSPRGTPEAGMGVDAADIDGDGRLDLVVTNFALETNTVYRNAGSGVFIDRRFADNLAEPTLHDLGFGTAAADFDHDGDLDLVFANGHILDNPEEVGVDSTYAQRNKLLENVGAGRFREATDAGLDVVRVSRGLAAGDLDLDGDLDLVIVNSNQLAEVYENVGADGRWLGVDLRPHAVGARLELRPSTPSAGAAEGGAPLLREVRTGASYLSQSSLTAHFGVGSAERATLAVRWPDGARWLLEGVPSGRRVLVARRSGLAVR